MADKIINPQKFYIKLVDTLNKIIKAKSINKEK